MSEILSGFSDYTQPHFWISVVEIIWINVLLSGDNAIVIALACRSLPPKQRFGGMVIGTGVALTMRLVFATVVSSLMLLPYIKIVGGAALLWIAVKLLTPDEPDQNTAAADDLWRAVKIIALADIVMSLDNVIAVAAAANGNTALLVFGLGISIPAIVAGATVIMAMLNYFPLIIWGGAAVLGWIAGDVIATDPIVVENTGPNAPIPHEKFRLYCSILGAVGVVLGGRMLRARRDQLV
ncbi:MAG TPA: YjbE family putative metal transport protein [Pseudolabrys sp.]|nr:YjbE family putative metal transport protein [Pseudolabrys sp.]